MARDDESAPRKSGPTEAVSRRRALLSVATYFVGIDVAKAVLDVAGGYEHLVVAALALFAFAVCKRLSGRAADVSVPAAPFSQRLITLRANR